MTNSILIPLEQQYLLLLSTSSPDQQHLISPPDQQHLIIDYTILPPLTSSPDQQHLISPPNQQHLILDFMSYSPQPLLQTSSTSFPLLINNVSSFFCFLNHIYCFRGLCPMFHIYSVPGKSGVPRIWSTPAQFYKAIWSAPPPRYVE